MKDFDTSNKNTMIMDRLINILRFLWEFPQNLLGIVLFRIYSAGCDSLGTTYGDARVLYSGRMRGGISLGRRIILPWHYRGDCSERSYVGMTLRHEYGHTVQSRRLGWLYLVVIGLPSITWAWAHSTFRRLGTVNYYSFYTERWADELGGVKR